MHKRIITANINTDNNIFDEIVKAIEYEHSKPASNIQEMKDRDNMRKKGDLWEHFCIDWLAALDQYDRVLSLEQFNQENPDIFKTKQDIGIDLIAITKDNKWHAVQCKYRKTKTLQWSTLSTFIALCERTRCFTKYIVITNAKYISKKLTKSPKDKSICYRTLANTPRDQWRKIIGHDTTIGNPVKLSVEELRIRRLQQFTETT